MSITNLTSTISTLTPVDMGMGVLFVVLLALYIMRRRSRRAKRS